MTKHSFYSVRNTTQEEFEQRHSKGNRFKIWRSKQPYWMNVIIDWALVIKDIVLLLIIGIAGMVLIAIIVMVLLQWAGNAYSG